MTTGGLERSCALVTGASSGIGEATARLLAGQGAAVALVARREDRLEELAAAIAHQGGRAEVIPADITSRDEALGAVDQAVERLGALDIVVNNAGVMSVGPATDALLDEWERMVHLNVLGLMYVTHASLPHLLDAAANRPRQVADLVNISSVAGRVARPGFGVYNLTKHGVGAFSESLRQEVTRRHVRVSLVEPGVVGTELLNHLRPEARAQVDQRFADIERLDASDIAEAVGFIVTRPRHMAVNELLVRPTEQPF